MVNTSLQIKHPLSSKAKIDLFVRVIAQGIGIFLLHLVSGINCFCVPKYVLWPLTSLLRFPSWSTEDCGGPGIPYEPMKRFTPEEDEQLRKNWLKFSKKHGLPYEDARYYAGYRSYKDDKSVIGPRMGRLQFLMESDFWPRMCHKLPQRSAQQVRARLIRIFDPALISGHQKLSYSKKYSYKVYLLYIILFSKISLFLAMGRTAKSCECKIHDIMARSGPIKMCRWKRLWKLVTNLTKLPDTSGNSFGKIIRKAIYDRNTETLKQYDEIIPWREISRKMIYDKKHCRQAWNDMLDSLQRGFNQEVSNDKSFGDAWGAAYQQVLKSPRPISCKNYGRFLHILMDATPVEATYESLSRRLYDIDGITRQLVIVRLILGKIVIVFFQINIYIVIRKEILSLHGFPALRRAAMVEALIVYSTKTYEDWVPPTALRKYVRYILKYMLMSDLRDTYLSHLPQFNGDKVASWISASDEVMPCDNVSVDDIITYLKALHKLKVFIDCYEHIRSSQQRDESDRIKMKLPRIERSLFIDCLIHVIRRIDPEWQPPVLFQKWVSL
uniref:RNA-directed RNA polymerase n=1 Tax=Heterorhabditis bacteriophora TaxID=37862 RepID=A0A1I7XM26_HETBA